MSYASDNMSSGNSKLPYDKKPIVYLNNSDELFHSAGLYSKEDIKQLKFYKYSRFGKPLDPYGKLNECREYLFFVKPDLHLCVPSNGSDDVYKLNGYDSKINNYQYGNLKMNPQLSSFGYFRYLMETHPQVVRELQYSAPSNNGPFSHLLSFACTSNLELPGQEATTMDTPMTIFGTSYKYMRDSEASEEAVSFSLEFLDDRDLNVYNFFKAYSEYHIARKSGLVTPPSVEYYKWKRLHNTMGIYKFLVGEDGETIIYWAYFWGVIPTDAPRSSFSNPSSFKDDGLNFSVSFEAAFMEDMNPVILANFNSLQMEAMNLSFGSNTSAFDAYIDTNSIPVVKRVNANETNDTIHVDGRLMKGCLVDTRSSYMGPDKKTTITDPRGAIPKLKWFA